MNTAKTTTFAQVDKLKAEVAQVLIANGNLVGTLTLVVVTILATRQSRS